MPSVRPAQFPMLISIRVFNILIFSCTHGCLQSLSRWLSAKKSTSKPAAPVDAPAVLPSATTNEPETSEAGAKEVIGSKKSVANLETVGKSKPSEKIKQKKQKKQKKAKKQKEPVKDKDDVELAEEEENLLFRQEGDYFVYTFEN